LPPGAQTWTVSAVCPDGSEWRVRGGAVVTVVDALGWGEWLP
jgi:hypothetical protein